MANVSITQLPAATTTSGADVIPIVQSGVTKQVTEALLFTSAVFTAPSLGTPAGGNLTNCTGLPAAGIGNVTAGIRTFLTNPSSANLAAALTDETGSGLAVFNSGATVTAINLGTPAGGNLANCTGLQIATGVTGMGSGMATFLGSPSSANLAAALTDETGTGVAVFNNAPTFAGMFNIPVFTTAPAGTSAGDATVLNPGFTLVTSGAAAAGVVLPAAAAGKIAVVKNYAASQTLKVYAPGSAIINALTTGTAYTLVTNGCSTFYCYGPTAWYSTPLVSS